ncbi:FtsJ-domain-containing protein, partial [Rhodotorula sp. JG-1b]
REQGYRARSAFKLVQLNRKYDFLASAKCVIDLCAAPGGWLQVAAKQMPQQNSIIIGVDLVPIKPIPRCITLVEDITTESCRRALRAEMKDWKADVVLHDGAPNVGSAWVQDAFTQVELVLASLKLAVEFLRPGGTFCTKVFRSKDYNSLLWVFNQLFTKVEATKPPSSRNVSAEIFVTCQGYLAPAKIDPKLLNPKFVFAEVDAIADEEEETNASKKNKRDVMTPASLNVFAPEKKRKQREGYDDDDRILYKECRVMEWIRHPDPIGVLSMVNRMRWAEAEDKELLKNPLTTGEIKACVDDLKVLGKKDFKMLLKYRTEIREDLGLDGKPEAVEAADANIEVEPIDEEEQLTNELERLARDEAFRKRRERRRANEKKAREVQRMQLNMVTPMDIGLERQDLVDDSEMFDLGEVEGGKARRGVKGGTLGSDDEMSDEDEMDGMPGRPINPIPEGAVRRDFEGEGEDEYDSDASDSERKARRLEESLDLLYESYQQTKLERDAKHKVKEQRRKRAMAEGGEFRGFNSDDDDKDSDESDRDDEEDFDPAPQPSESEGDSSDEEVETQLVPSKATKAIKATKSSAPAAKAKTTAAATAAEKKQKAGLLTNLKAEKVLSSSAKSRQAEMWFDQPAFKGLPGGLDALLNGGDDDASDAEEEDESFEEDDEGVKSVWDELDEDEDDEDQEDGAEEEGDSESDDDFDGAREEFEEDEEMEEEADIEAEEKAEIEKAERIAKLGLTTAEAMTLAQQLVNQERTRTQLVDEGFNRHTDVVGGDGLPSWFIDDEQRHFRHNIPITKDAVQAIRDKQRELNARPIKKVAEAKARKKMRTIRRLEKMKAKAQGINDDEENGLTEKEKAASIAKVLARSAKAGKTKKPETKLVVARGPNRGISGRPKGVKGKYKIVDSRMKKEVRALKRIQKRD